MFVLIFFDLCSFISVDCTTLNKLLVDINECETNNGGCAAQASCTNTVGSFTCKCKSGYTGDGKSCKGNKD